MGKGEKVGGFSLPMMNSRAALLFCSACPLSACPSVCQSLYLWSGVCLRDYHSPVHVDVYVVLKGLPLFD